MNSKLTIKVYFKLLEYRSKHRITLLRNPTRQYLFKVAIEKYCIDMVIIKKFYDSSDKFFDFSSFFEHWSSAYTRKCYFLKQVYSKFQLMKISNYFSARVSVWRNILGECRPWWKGGEGWPGGDGFNRSILGSTSVTLGRGAGGAWHSPDPVGRTSTFASRTCNRGRELRRMPSMKIFGYVHLSN